MFVLAGYAPDCLQLKGFVFVSEDCPYNADSVQYSVLIKMFSVTLFYFTFALIFKSNVCDLKKKG